MGSMFTKKDQERRYREGIKLDVESVASRAKSMTGKDPSKMSNAAVAKANREYDAQDRREAKHYTISHNVNGKAQKNPPY